MHHLVSSEIQPRCGSGEGFLQESFLGCMGTAIGPWLPHPPPPLCFVPSVAIMHFHATSLHAILDTSKLCVCVSASLCPLPLGRFTVSGAGWIPGLLLHPNMHVNMK